MMMIISVLCNNKSCQICSREEQEEKYSIRAACSGKKNMVERGSMRVKIAPQLLSVASTGCAKERCSSGMLLDDPRGISRPSDQPACKIRLKCGIVPQSISLKAAVPKPSAAGAHNCCPGDSLAHCSQQLSTLYYNVLLPHPRPHCTPGTYHTGITGPGWSPRPPS